jgi:hypothetical protein
MAKHWIAGAVKKPGSLRNAARKAGESTQGFAEAHKHSSGKVGQRARLALTFAKMKHG